MYCCFESSYTEKSWHSLSMHYLRRCASVTCIYYVCIRTYKRIKKITRNTARLNRKWVNLQDRQKVIYLLGSKRKNAIISDYVQNRLPSSFSGICIKNLRSRRSSVFFRPVLLVCFCCVCIVLFRVCIALSCECILLSAFNGYFIRFLFRLRKFFI